MLIYRQRLNWKRLHLLKPTLLGWSRRLLNSIINLISNGSITMGLLLMWVIDTNILKIILNSEYADLLFLIARGKIYCIGNLWCSSKFKIGAVPHEFDTKFNFNVLAYTNFKRLSTLLELILKVLGLGNFLNHGDEKCCNLFFFLVSF